MSDRLPLVTDASMAYRGEGRLIVIVHAVRSPGTLEWETFLNWLRERGHSGEDRVVVYSYGGGPDGTQRKKLADLASAVAFAPAALLTSSIVMRATGAALSWLIRSMKVFPLDGDDDAFRFLGLLVAEMKRVRVMRAELERELSLTKDVTGSGTGTH